MNASGPEATPHGVEEDMVEDRRDWRRIAYHEAGHVVVGHLLGLRLMDADLYPDEGGGNGHTNFEPATPQESRRRAFVERVVITFLAGFAAETKYAGTKDWDGSGWDVDMSLREWASLISRDPAERFELLERLTARADEIVNRPRVWRAIGLVAERLFEKRRLDRAEALELVERGLGRSSATA